jgi:hypothetical protein
MSRQLEALDLDLALEISSMAPLVEDPIDLVENLVEAPLKNCPCSRIQNLRTTCVEFENTWSEWLP